MLGTKIRDKRTEMGMNIKELAEKTGLTSGFISQIERGLAEPSITSLRNIANELGVAVFYFLIDDVDKNPVVRKEERQILKFAKSDLTYELLSPDLNRQMEMVMVKLQTGQSTSEELFSHSGEEVIYVLQGIMWIKIGEEEYTLAEGDTIHFSCNTPHKLTNTGQTEFIGISVSTPPHEFDSFKPKIKKKQ